MIKDEVKENKNIFFRFLIRHVDITRPAKIIETAFSPTYHLQPEDVE